MQLLPFFPLSLRFSPLFLPFRSILISKVVICFYSKKQYFPPSLVVLINSLAINYHFRIFPKQISAKLLIICLCLSVFFLQIHHQKSGNYNTKSKLTIAHHLWYTFSSCYSSFFEQYQ